MFFLFPSHNATVHLSKNAMNFFMERKNCAILSVDCTGQSFPPLYIWYLLKSLFKHHRALAFVLEEVPYLLYMQSSNKNETLCESNSGPQS